MSKKPFRSQASSSRAVSGGFTAQSGTAFGSSLGSSSLGAVASSPLSYVYEPPDLSGFSEPNLGVAFKNLQKKDGTTKAKALEDLQAYVASLTKGKGGLEDAVLGAWVKIYPRTSIDTSRRVRQLAHTVQGQISASCGKRMAKHMPALVPSWLAGQFDSDKSVSRAANEAFLAVFNSNDKRENIWRFYQSAIIEYAQAVVALETPSSLSDERTVSPDDASAKYSRAVGAAVTIASNLLGSVSRSDLEKSQLGINTFLDDEKLWKLASDSDSFVRRALYRLLVVALSKYKDTLDLTIISASVLTSGLHTSQVGSALDFVKAMATLSSEFPEVWTTHYTGTGRKSAEHRLCYFLKKGSQGAPAEFWSQLLLLLSRLPGTILVNGPAESSISSSDYSSYSSVLTALHEGINNKDETRLNQSAAWSTYLDACELVQLSIADGDGRDHFYRASVLPILAQYISPVSEELRWTLVGSQQSDLCVRACLQSLRGAYQAFREEWLKLSAKLAKDLKTSQPEQSKDFSKSQDSVATACGRWYRLQKSLLESDSKEVVAPIFSQHTPAEIFSALSTLNSRSGEPYGAAAAVEHAVKYNSELLLGNGTLKAALADFASNSIPNLLLSLSAKHLIRLLDLLDSKIELSGSYDKCMEILSAVPPSTAKSAALQNFLSSPRLAHSQTLRDASLLSLKQAMQNDDEASWEVVLAAVSNEAAPRDLTDSILAALTEGLSISTQHASGLHGLEIALERSQDAVKRFTLSAMGPSLLSKLLLLADSSDAATSRRAKTLSKSIEQGLSVSGGNGLNARPMVEIINEGFINAAADSLSVDALLVQAQSLLEKPSSAHTMSISEDLLPSGAQCSVALGHFVTRKPSPSVAVMNRLGGAVYFVPSSSHPTSEQVSRDFNGFSSPFRMAQYITRLIRTTDIFENISLECKAVICQFIAVFVELAGDDLSVPGPMSLWEYGDLDLEMSIADCVVDTKALLASWLHTLPLPEFVSMALKQLLDDSSGNSAPSYYNARACSAMASEIHETQNIVPFAYLDPARIRLMQKSSDDTYSLAAILTSSTEYKEMLRLCNDIVADLTGEDFQQPSNHQRIFRQFVLLNCISRGQERVVVEMPKQRLIFFVKHVVQQCQISMDYAPGSLGEVLNIMPLVLNAISEIYGSFWAELLALVQQVWLQPLHEDTIYNIYSSLRLLSLLRRRDLQEVNDDLLEAWTERKGPVANGLIDLMSQLQDVPDDSHQPRRIINELLSRNLASLSEEVTVGTSKFEGLYAIIASESTALQCAAYGVLHSAIPATQEQISVDKALSSEFTARLPEELLSLILAPPSIDMFEIRDFDRSMPPTLRSYLLSWQLTFDHWQNASYKLQGDYANTLKEGTYVQDFLAFALSLLITDRTRPVDASRFDIESPAPPAEETPERETHWLLTHLYYLCLRHLPSPTKEWWRDSASRQLNLALETWTEKYVSPLIISQELSSIVSWGPSQALDDQPMTIKTSPSAREITASISVDEQTMTIAIRLPSSYPLARVEVSSVHRVAVPENKWQAWIRTTQGVIQTSSGSAGEGRALIDGLMLWRKNVSATMKGQTECAICYSVISAEKSLPTKRCSTCKNMFHGSCLFRWFKSSNSSSCPLCRNAFNYS